MLKQRPTAPASRLTALRPLHTKPVVKIKHGILYFLDVNLCNVFTDKFCEKFVVKIVKNLACSIDLRCATWVHSWSGSFIITPVSIMIYFWKTRLPIYIVILLNFCDLFKYYLQTQQSLLNWSLFNALKKKCLSMISRQYV